MHYVSRETGYYLPLTYNDNKIVLLVRDPNWLYAYWEVSNEKRENFVRQFGENAWNNSRPVIKLTNVTQNKVKIIEINDFASSWFIEANQPNSTFSAELGRMFSGDFFVTLATSNSVQTPTNKPSKNDTVYFADFNDVRTTKKVDIKVDLGKYEKPIETGSVGVSSGIVSLSGVSSESFIK